MTKVSKTAQAEHHTILSLYPRAFPNEDLTPLVRELLSFDDCLSFNAKSEGDVIGHIAFTYCTAPEGTALLGPLAVEPDHQRKGVGKALVQKGLSELKAKGATRVFVLGDPNYYGQFGFTREDAIETPYPLPVDWAAAWQSLDLASKPLPAQKLCVPTPWQRPEYW